MNPNQTNDQLIYRFDGFVVDTQNFVIEHNGSPVTLPPRGFDVLLLLLRHRGTVVEKSQIFEEIWKETFVSDNALTKVIKELRHALSDSATEPRYIETIPKRGYRFIADVHDRDALSHEPASITQPPLTITTAKLIAMVMLVLLTAGALWYALDGEARRTNANTIAVLPFKPLDTNSRDESLELGMASTLIMRLSNLRDIVVTPIGSVRKFSDPALDPISAGKELQVGAVLDGNIQKSGDRVRVTVRLLDVQSGASLWSDNFDESFTDIFSVQDSIAQRIAGVLTLRLSRDEQEQLAKHMTENPEAYELYLKGQFHWHRRGPDWITESLSAYKQAVEKDPNFALAHIGVADANIMLSGHRRITMQEAEANAEPAIRRALQIDDRLAQAHNALAELRYQYQYDWNGAESEFRIAIDLNPNVAWIHQAYGWFLMSDGRFEEANAEMERARQLDPSSMTLSAARGRLYYFSRQYDRAIEHFRELLPREPTDMSLRLALADAYVQRGMHAEALDQIIGMMDREVPQAEKDELRAALATGGWDAVNRKRLAEVEERFASSGRPNAMHLANAYVRVGDKDKAFEWFEKLFDKHDVSILQFKIEPAYDVLRDDPRYAHLLARIGQKP